MQKYILPFIALAAITSPALANEARIEARGSVAFGQGSTEDSWGLAAGYDYDLSETGFVGVEVSGDKIGASGTKVAFGLTGRAGIKASTGTRVFAAGGYTTEGCTGCDAMWHGGGGFEQNISSNVYGKMEYRHYFVRNSAPDYDAIAVGVGIRF